MSTACLHARSMSKMIQIRNVPDDLHRTLKARAATEGMSLSDYLLRELRQLTAQPTPAEFLERLRQREPVKLRVPSRHYSRDAWAVIVLDASVVVELLLGTQAARPLAAGATCSPWLVQRSPHCRPAVRRAPRGCWRPL